MVWGGLGLLVLPMVLGLAALQAAISLVVIVVKTEICVSHLTILGGIFLVLTAWYSRSRTVTEWAQARCSDLQLLGVVVVVLGGWGYANTAISRRLGRGCSTTHGGAGGGGCRQCKCRCGESVASCFGYSRLAFVATLMVTVVLLLVGGLSCLSRPDAMLRRVRQGARIGKNARTENVD